MIESIFQELTLSINEYILNKRNQIEILNLFDSTSWIQIEDFYISPIMLIDLINYLKTFSLNKVSFNSIGGIFEFKDGYLKIIKLINEKKEKTLYLNSTTKKIKILNFPELEYKIVLSGLLEYKSEEVIIFLSKLDFKFFMEYKFDANRELIKAPLLYTFQYMKRLIYYECDNFNQEIKSLIEDKLYTENIYSLGEEKNKDVLITESYNLLNKEKETENQLNNIQLETKNINQSINNSETE